MTGQDALEPVPTCPECEGTGQRRDPSDLGLYWCMWCCGTGRRDITPTDASDDQERQS